MNNRYVNSAILDTGPWVALIDRSEARHHVCVEWLKNHTGHLYTTEAVLTEVMYLLNFSLVAQMAALDFILESIVELVPSDIAAIEKSKQLMRKYHDLPMDYADATLLCLAEDTGIHTIVTFDNDFSIYKINKNQPVNILPEHE